MTAMEQLFGATNTAGISLWALRTDLSFSPCLLTVSLLCLRLSQFLLLPLWLVLLPASSLCVCWGVLPPEGSLVASRERGISPVFWCEGSFPPLWPRWAFWQNGCGADALLSSAECRTWRRRCPSSPAGNLSCPQQGRCCVQLCTSSQSLQSGFVTLTSIPLAAEVAQMSYTSPEQWPQCLLPAGLCKVSLAHRLARQYSHTYWPAGCCHPLIIWYLLLIL